MFPKMPYRIEHQEVRGDPRPFKVYPSGASEPASQEELSVWVYIEALREQCVKAAQIERWVHDRGNTKRPGEEVPKLDPAIHEALQAMGRLPVASEEVQDIAILGK